MRGLVRTTYAETMVRQPGSTLPIPPPSPWVTGRAPAELSRVVTVAVYRSPTTFHRPLGWTGPVPNGNSR